MHYGPGGNKNIYNIHPLYRITTLTDNLAKFTL